jgi:hypothetical protein
MLFSRSDQHRRRALEAQQRMAQVTEPAQKLTFEEIANHWLGLVFATILATRPAWGGWLKRPACVSGHSIKALN